MKNILIILMLSVAAIFGTGCTDIFGNADEKKDEVVVENTATAEAPVVEAPAVSAEKTDLQVADEALDAAKEARKVPAEKTETVPVEKAESVQDLLRITEERTATVAKIDLMLKELRVLQQALKQANENNDNDK